MALMVVQDAKDRLYVEQSIDAPPGLTDAIVTSYITGATAEILNRLGLGAEPAAGNVFDQAAEVCKRIVVIRLRIDFFGLDGAAMEALRKQEASALESLDNLRADQVRVGGRVYSKLIGGS